LPFNLMGWLAATNELGGGVRAVKRGEKGEIIRLHKKEYMITDGGKLILRENFDMTGF